MAFLNRFAIFFIMSALSGCILKNPPKPDLENVSVENQVEPIDASGERVSQVLSKLSEKAISNQTKSVVVAKNLNFFDAVHSAVKKSPQIERAAQQVLSAGFGKDIALSGKEIQLSTTGGVGVSAQRKNSVNTDRTGASVTVQGALLLFDGGVLDSRIDAAGAQYLVAETNLDVESEKLAYEASSAWINLWSAKEAEDLFLASRDEIDLIRNQLEILKSTGILNVGEFAGIENKMNDLALSQQKNQQLVKLAKLDFEIYFGDLIKRTRVPPLSQIVDKTDTFDTLELPILKKLLLEQAIAEFRVKEAKAALKPTVKSIASLSSPQSVNGSSDAKIGFFVDYTISDGGSRAARIAAAEAEFSGFEAEIRHQFRVAEVGLNTAKSRLNSNQSLIQMSSKKVELLNEQIKAATSQKALGQTAIQKLFALKIEKFEAQMALIKLRGETYTSALDLKFASGNLLNLFDL